MMTPESLKKILIARFNRKGDRSSRTMPFDEFAPLVKRDILKSIKLKTAEEPVIASILDNDKWVLLTTDRTIWQRDGEIAYIDNKSIRRITIDFAMENKKSTQRKMDFAYIKIFDADGIERILEVESGVSHMAVLNTLMYFQNLNAYMR